MKQILIIGAGLAGYTVARELRKLDKTVPLTIVTADNGSFYSKPMLSNAFAQNKSAAQLTSQDATQMATQLQATILTDTQVLSLDTAGKRVNTSRGAQEYDRLVLAVGAAPIRLELGGNAASEVISVNHLEHYGEFRGKLAALDHSRRVAILGAGLIGCEFADDLAGSGHAVTLIDPQAAPLAAIAPPDISTGLAHALKTRGVNLRMGVSATEVRRAGAAFELVLNEHSTVEADLVLSAVGLRPALDLAQSGGVHTERGIVVDTYGQTSVAGVYALGDCAQYGASKDGGVTMPYIAPLMSAARAIAITLAGTPTKIDRKPAPVIVKTPSYPIALIPAPMPLRAGGKWLRSQQGEALVMRFYDAEDTLQGFALAPHNAEMRQQLLGELGEKSIQSECSSLKTINTMRTA